MNDARARALSEGTPHLVYFNAPEVDAERRMLRDGGRGARHRPQLLDHGRATRPREFKLSDKACKTVKPYGEGSDPSAEIAAVPLPAEDRAVRAPDAAAVGIVPTVAAPSAGTVGGIGSTVAAVAGAVGGGSSSSGSGSSSGTGSESEDSEDSSGSGSSSSGKGSGKAAGTATASGQVAKVARTATIAETVVNGATFPIDAVSGRPVIAFSERGVRSIPPARPVGQRRRRDLPDRRRLDTVYAAVVSPLGDVQLRVFDAGTSGWR